MIRSSYICLNFCLVREDESFEVDVVHRSDKLDCCYFAEIFSGIAYQRNTVNNKNHDGNNSNN